MAPERKASLNTHYTNTHDRFFRSCFSHVAYARALFQVWLPEQMQAMLNFEAIENKESSLPSIAKESDLLFSAGSKGKREICILLEHKHQRHLRNTYRQMADYRVAIKHSALSRNERPVIVNCIFYHGRQVWEKQQKQGIYRVTYDAGIDGIESLLLHFHVLDLGRMDESLWPSKGALHSILYALLKVPQLGDRVRTEGQEFFRHFLYHLDREDTINLLPSVVSYIADVSNLNYNEVLNMAKSSEAKNLNFLENWEKIMGNPWKEDGRKQGLEKGLKQGRVEGLETGLKKGLEKGRAEERVAVAVNMLKEGFSIPIIVKATGLSANEIAALKKG